MEQQPLRAWRTHRFPVLVGGLAAVWLVLALVACLSGGAAARTLLVLWTGGILLAGFAWYAATSWAGRRGPTALQRLRRPVTLFLLGWLLCLGTVLASGLTRKSGEDSPPQSPTKAEPEEPPSKLFPKGPVRFLSDLEEFDVKSGMLPFRKNGDLGDGKPIVVAGVPSPKGIGMHPPWAPDYAAAKFRLGKEAAVFKAVAALNDPVTWNWSPATFTVLGDGRELWKSGPISFTHLRSHSCTVDVTGVDVLELRVQAANGANGTVAVWVEPRVLRRADTPE